MNKAAVISAFDAITQRHSVRCFLDRDVSLEIVVQVLKLGSRAPSGNNIQPWHVHVVTGDAKNRLSEAVTEAANNGERTEEYAYMPTKLNDAHLARRRKVGFDLYGLYGIKRGDLESRKAAMLRNFMFFGAPVGIFFTMDRYLLAGSWLDCGMFIQNVMFAAQCYGLASCPQQAWCEYGDLVHQILDISNDQVLISGMSIGYEDGAAIENQLHTERAAIEEFVTFHGTGPMVDRDVI